MKQGMKKLLVTLLSTLLFCTAFVTAAVADDTPTTLTDPAVTNGTYDDSGWQQGGDGEVTLDDGTILRKTAKPVTGENGTFEVTLEVIRNEKTIVVDTATVFVIDTSGSMKEENRLVNLKEAMTGDTGILQSMHDEMQIQTQNGVNSGAECLVAIVDFNTNATLALGWTDIATDTGLQAAKSAVNKMKADGGTNMDAGLHYAYDLFNQDATDAVKGIGQDFRNIILLTDGAPTFHNHKTEDKAGTVEIKPGITYTYTKPRFGGRFYQVTDWADGYAKKGGTGNTTDDTTFISTVKAADKIKDDGIHHLFTIAFGSASAEKMDFDEDWNHSHLEPAGAIPDDLTLAGFLKEFIASPEEAFEADADGLAEVLTKIRGKLKHSGEIAGTVVIDPMGEDVNLNPNSVQPSIATITDNNTKITLDLGEVTPTVVGEEGNRTYTYTLKYQVALKEGKADGIFHNTNELTTIQFNDGTSGNFPVPGVKAMEKVSVTASKEWYLNAAEGAEPLKIAWPHGAEVQVNLMVGNTVKDRAILTEREQSHKFENLDRFDQNGKEINYRVEEATTIPGYTPEYVNNNGTITIKNNNPSADNWYDKENPVEPGTENDYDHLNTDPNTPADSIPDNLQALISYQSANEAAGTVSNSLDIVTIYQLNGEKTPEEERVIHGSTASAKPGYVFAYWTLNDSQYKGINPQEDGSVVRGELDNAGGKRFVYTAHFAEIKAGIEVNKEVANPKANNVPFAVGETIEYKITVSALADNNVTIHEIKVSDDLAGVKLVTGKGYRIVSDEDGEYALIEELKAAESVTVKAEYEVTEDDYANGQSTIANTAHASGRIPTSEEDPKLNPPEVPTPVEGEDSTQWPRPVMETSITIEKQLAREEYSQTLAVGDTVHFTLRVTNTSNVKLENIVVTDDDAKIVAYDGGDYTVEAGQAKIAALDAGQGVVVKAEHVLTAEDIENERYVNKAKVTAPNPTGGEDLIAEDSYTIDAYPDNNNGDNGGNLPIKIHITKTWEQVDSEGNINNVPPQGAEVTVTVKADGQTVKTVTLKDNTWTADFRLPKVKEDGATIVYTIEETVTGVKGTELVSDSDVLNPEGVGYKAELVNRYTDTWDDEEDDPHHSDDIPDAQQVKINYVADDNGTVDNNIDIVTVFKDGKEITDPLINGATAKANEGYKFVEWTLDSDDNYHGLELKEDGKDTKLEGGQEYTYHAHFELINVKIEVIKTIANRKDDNKPFLSGETVQYNIAVKAAADNNVTVHAIKVVDTKEGVEIVAGEGYDLVDDQGQTYALIAELEPGKEVIVNAIYEVTEADYVNNPNGTLVNHATASGRIPTSDEDPTIAPPVKPDPVEGENSSYWPLPQMETAITLDKQLDADAMTNFKVGDPVRFKLIVSNPSNVTINDIFVSDDDAVIIEGEGYTIENNQAHIAKLGVGENIVVEAEHVLTADDIENERYVNNAKATAEDPAGGEDLIAEDNYTIDADPTNNNGDNGGNLPIKLQIMKTWEQVDSEGNVISNNPPQGAEVTVIVKADGEIVARKVLDETWTADFRLPKVNEKGETIAYTIEETVNGVKGTELADGSNVLDDDYNAELINRYTDTWHDKDDDPQQDDDIPDAQQVKINYVADNNGTVDNHIDIVTVFKDGKAITDPLIKGATAKANEGYKFVEWTLEGDDNYHGLDLKEDGKETKLEGGQEYTYHAHFELIKAELKVTKEVANPKEGNEAFTAGETIKYNIRVNAPQANNVTIHAIRVTDDLAGVELVAGEGYDLVEEQGQTYALIAELEPGKEVIVNAVYEVTEDDYVNNPNGTLVNKAKASGQIPTVNEDPTITPPTEPDPVEDEGTAIWPQPEMTSGITIIKRLVAHEKTYDVGDELEFTLTVTNTSNVTLNELTVEDEFAQIEEGTGYTLVNEHEAEIRTLAPGESVILKVTHAVTREDLRTGVYRNVTTVTTVDPRDPEGEPLKDSDTYVVDNIPTNDDPNPEHHPEEPGEEPNGGTFAPFVPETGDIRHLSTWVIVNLFALCAAGVLLYFLVAKKRKHGK